MEVIVVCAILGILAALLLSGVHAARITASRLSCASNLKNIGIALQNYSSKFGSFPPIVSQTALDPRNPGVSAHCFSPLARLLAELDNQEIYNAINFTNIPDLGVGVSQNFTVLKVSLDVFLCPADPQPVVPGLGRSNYRFSIGPTHTLAPGSSKPESALGPFTTHKTYRPADFHDGLTNTIGVSERLQGDWISDAAKKGGDYAVRVNGPQILDSSAAVKACQELDVNAPRESRGGESWFFSGLHFTNFNHCVPPNADRSSCALRGRLESLHDRVIGEGVFPPTSRHSHGVNACYMDGSVRFVRDAISPAVWRALGTRASGDVVSLGE